MCKLFLKLIKNINNFGVLFSSPIILLAKPFSESLFAFIHLILYKKRTNYKLARIYYNQSDKMAVLNLPISYKILQDQNSSISLSICSPMALSTSFAYLLVIRVFVCPIIFEITSRLMLLASVTVDAKVWREV